MNKEDIIKRIPSVLESIGVFGAETMDEETDLNEWIIDSLMFISFIVELENVFEVQIPDALLQQETISSLRGLADIIFGLKEEGDKKRNSEECEDLENEIKSIKKLIDELYDKLKGDLTKEEQDEILVEIADKRTIIRDIECMIADMK